MSENLQEPMVFEDLEPIKVEVTLKGKQYWLREAREGVVGKITAAQAKLIKRDSNGKPTGDISDKVGELDALIVSLCLFDEQGRQTPISEILTWKHEVVDKIARRAKQISKLVEDEQTEEQLEEKIKDLQEKLDAIRSKKNGKVTNPLAPTSTSVES